jgi:GT2 family glycosyltransferase
MNPSVSVIIVNYNGQHFLRECLPSLNAQSYRDFEACVVDNGSTDCSLHLIESNFPWVHVITSRRNLGFCGGNNLAIRETKSEFVALLNNDTVVEPSWLEELVQMMRRNPEVGICASRVLYLAQPEIIYAAGDSYAIWGAALKRGSEEGAAGNFGEPTEVFSACACAALYRRSMLDEIGLFDEEFFSHCEDVDLGFRARLAGYTCVYVPSAIVYHHGGGTAGVQNPRVEFLSSRNSEYVFFKNMPGALLFRYLPVHVAYVGWSIMRRTTTGLAAAHLKGKFAFLATLGRTIRRRASVQQMRKIRPDALVRVMDRELFRKLTLKANDRQVPAPRTFRSVNR